MFSKLSSIYRLLLCLLLSIGVHGGVVFYGWMTTPAESRLVHAPVMVSLLPAAEVSPQLLTKNASAQTAPVPSKMKSREVAPGQTRTVQKIKPSAPKLPAKTLPKKPLVAEAAEMVCMVPQEVASENELDAVADSRVDLASTEVGVAVNISVATESQPDTLVDAKSALENTPGASAQELVEATPNYRSNPLPRYPYLARQKHWQGVVWLLVDVSAQGQVNDLRIEQSCGHRILDRAASRTVREWQFYPATRAGLPVTSQVRIPVRFRLEGS